jgi:hypothetical protein
VAGEFPVGAKSLFHSTDRAAHPADFARVTVRGLALEMYLDRDLLNVKYHGFRAVVLACECNGVAGLYAS